MLFDMPSYMRLALLHLLFRQNRRNGNSCGNAFRIPASLGRLPDQQSPVNALLRRGPCPYKVQLPNDPEEKDTYDVLCSSFNFSAPYIHHLSVNNFQYQLSAPITETPLDCSPVFPIMPGKLGLEDVSKVKCLAQFSCPM
jgi:hypothetical protein